MNKNSKKRYFILFAIAYFLSSQATVVCIMSELYSTGGDATVAWQDGPIREHAGLSWTPRTHLPENEQSCLPAEEPPTTAFYPSEKPGDIDRSDQPRPPLAQSYYAPLSNKAPPRV
jgi:hypothetical protein